MKIQITMEIDTSITKAESTIYIDNDGTRRIIPVRLCDLLNLRVLTNAHVGENASLLSRNIVRTFKIKVLDLESPVQVINQRQSSHNVISWIGKIFDTLRQRQT